MSAPWTMKELEIVAEVYAQEYQKVKYKIDANGAFNAVKKRGSVSNLHKMIVERLKNGGLQEQLVLLKVKSLD